MLTDIISISGKPGLYKMVSSSEKSIIVESLQDKKRFPVFSNSQVSALKDIAIYTDETEVGLSEVLQNLYTTLDKNPCEVVKGKPTELEELMRKVLPNYDADRVYPSDMKKIFGWYNSLLKNNLIDFSDTAESKNEE